MKRDIIYNSNHMIYKLLLKCKNIIDECKSPDSDMYSNQCVDKLYDILNSKEVLDILKKEQKYT